MKDKIKQLADDYAAVLKEAKSMGCNEVRALYNIPLENMELIVQALEAIKELSDRNMTTEVLENYMQFEDECVKKGFTFKSVIEAREKQISKRAYHISPVDNNGNANVECPACHATTDYAVNVIKRGYCWKCGQLLDWSDEEIVKAGGNS